MSLKRTDHPWKKCWNTYGLAWSLFSEDDFLEISSRRWNLTDLAEYKVVEAEIVLNIKLGDRYE